MARVTLDVQEISMAGLECALSSVGTDGAKFENQAGDVFLLISGGAAGICTITATGYLRGEPIADRVVTTTSGGLKMIGPFPPNAFNDGGEVYVEYNKDANMAALRLPVVE